MIRLCRQIDVYSFDVAGTVSLGRRRDELIAVAHLAQEFGPLDGTGVSRYLLGQASARLGERLLDYAVEVGLLVRKAGRDSPAILTEAGTLALETGEVLEPEEATWRIFWTTDSLVDAGIVHVARLPQENAGALRDQVRSAKNRHESGLHAERRPMTLDRKLTVPLTSAADGRAFRLDALEAQGQSGPKGAIRLTLEFAGSAASLGLHGVLSGPDERAPVRVDAKLPSPSAAWGLTEWDIWRTLVSQASSVGDAVLQQWFERTGVPTLPKAFESTGVAERRQFRTDIEVASVNLELLGRFEGLVLRDAAVVPRTRADANRWAEWRLLDALDDYQTPATLAALREKVVDSFPWHAIQLPADDDMLRVAKSAPQQEKSRFLLASADLGLWSSP